MTEPRSTFPQTAPGTMPLRCGVRAETMGFVLAAAGLGIDLLDWEADWEGARVLLCQSDLDTPPPHPAIEAASRSRDEVPTLSFSLGPPSLSFTPEIRLTQPH